MRKKRSFGKVSGMFCSSYYVATRNEDNAGAREPAGEIARNFFRAIVASHVSAVKNKTWECLF